MHRPGLVQRTCEHGCVGASKIIQRYTGTLDSFISNFQEHALLGIHCDRFLGRDVKEDVVESVDEAVVKHVGFVDIRETFAWSAVRMVKAFDVETSNFALNVP